MKSFITYAGGKSFLAPWIKSLFPKDYQSMTYVEPFAGGLSVMINKQKSKIEIASDINYIIYTFYKILKEQPIKLFNNIKLTTFSELEFKRAYNIYYNKIQSNDFQKACSFFVLSKLSFSANLQTFGWGVTDKSLPLKFRLCKLRFMSYQKRLSTVSFFKKQANEIIEQYDSPNTLFYLDPPYPETDQNAYMSEEFTIKNFNDLLTRLKKIKGKFVLSCYKKSGMEFHPNWNFYYKSTRCTVNLTATGNRSNPREELAITNF